MKYITGLINLIISLVISTIIIYAIKFIAGFAGADYSFFNGEVFVTLHPYRFELHGIKSPNDLMNASFGSYGETNKTWTAEDAKGFIKISSNAHKIFKTINPSKK